MGKFRDAIEFLPVWLLLKSKLFLPLNARAAIAGRAVGGLISTVPGLRRSSEENLTHIFPDMSETERRRICKQMGRNIGRTLTEILCNDEFAKQKHRFIASGPGLATLRQVRESGQGAIIVSGHYGQWEAIRHFLKEEGMETGAVYRPTRNRYYEPLFLSSIRKGGEPIVPRGYSGMRDLVKHLRNGGFISIMIDQRQNDGVLLPFMGEPALTSTAAAEMALKYNIPLVPAFGKRADSGNDIEISFEAAVPPSDPESMTLHVNSHLEDRVREAPEQWFWMHRRWYSPLKPA